MVKNLVKLVDGTRKQTNAIIPTHALLEGLFAQV